MAKNKKKGISIRRYIEIAESVEYPYIEDLKKTLTVGPFVTWAMENGIFKNWCNIHREERESVAKNVGCKNIKEYIVKGERFWKRDYISITNDYVHLQEFIKNELELDKLKEFIKNEFE